MDVYALFLGGGVCLLLFVFLYMWRGREWTSLPVFWVGGVCCCSLFYTCGDAINGRLYPFFGWWVFVAVRFFIHAETP
jgi:hypothetical protein